jgi:hypothetical protein
MKTVYFSETLVSTYKSTRRHDPEQQQHRHLHSSEKLKSHQGDQIYKEVSGTCSTHGGDGKFNIIWLENLNERDHSGDLGVTGRIILKLFSESVWEDVDWIQLAQDRF